MYNKHFSLGKYHDDIQNNNRTEIIRNNINNLKEEMIHKNKAEFGKYDLRFINENNKYFVAKENIQVLLIIFLSLMSLIN